MAKTSDLILHEKEKRKSIEAQAKQQREKHQMRMKELEFSRESDQIRHDNDMSKMRIRSAEMNRLQTRKEQFLGSRYRDKGGERR